MAETCTLSSIFLGAISPSAKGSRSLLLVVRTLELLWRSRVVRDDIFLNLGFLRAKMGGGNLASAGSQTCGGSSGACYTSTEMFSLRVVSCIAAKVAIAWSQTAPSATTQFWSVGRRHTHVRKRRGLCNETVPYPQAP